MKATSANSTLAIGGVSSPHDSFVVAENLVLRTNFRAEKPTHQQSANCYRAFQINDTVRQLIYLLPMLILTSCWRQDDFYTVTKIIDIQDTIVVNEPFSFRLILRNDSLTEMKFTIDDTVQKSVFFNLDFHCKDQQVESHAENPKSKRHNYQKYYLKNGDSLSYQLSGIFRQVNDKLNMEIKGYERTYSIDKITCGYLTINFDGMWIPGDINPIDAMEGYNFRKKIFVKLDTTKTHR